MLVNVLVSVGQFRRDLQNELSRDGLPAWAGGARSGRRSRVAELAVVDEGAARNTHTPAPKPYRPEPAALRDYPHCGQPITIVALLTTPQNRRTTTDRRHPGRHPPTPRPHHVTSHRPGGEDDLATLETRSWRHQWAATSTGPCAGGVGAHEIRLWH
jgi:hypothetical protein